MSIEMDVMYRPVEMLSFIIYHNVVLTNLDPGLFGGWIGRNGLVYTVCACVKYYRTAFQ